MCTGFILSTKKEKQKLETLWPAYEEPGPGRKFEPVPDPTPPSFKKGLLHRFGVYKEDKMTVVTKPNPRSTVNTIRFLDSHRNPLAVETPSTSPTSYCYFYTAHVCRLRLCYFSGAT